MSVESQPALEFVDANVLVYAHDSSAGDKKVAAEALLARLWTTATGSLSVQVLQEFFVTVTRKVAHPLSAEAAAQLVADFSAWRVFSPTLDDVLAAISIHQKAKLEFWDAMVVQAAAESGASVLWTEDLNDGQVINGVRVRNPFVDVGTASEQITEPGEQA